jgi:3-oxoadipate enol-lactonase
VDDADTLFQVELPALQGWGFTAELARKVKVPVLAVLGGESAPLFGEGHELLKRWLPQSEPYTLPGARHLLQIENPGAIAAALSGFFARHPIGALPGASQAADRKPETGGGVVQPRHHAPVANCTKGGRTA